jgi:fibronectin-binding autotransporter adhesin
MAQMIWDGGGGDNNWSTAANWALDVAPSAGDDLVFPAGASRLTNVNDLAAGTRLNTIQFQGSGYSITGNSIELSGGLTANNAAGANSLGLDITLINAQNFVSANPSTTLTLSGAIHTGNLVGATFILGTTALNFDGAGTTNVTGVIDGSGSILKQGNGTLVLAGANTYQGFTDVRQGVVRAEHNSALGNSSTGDTQIQTGAALHVAGNISIGESFALREGGIGFGDGTDDSTLGGLRSVGGTNTITGNIDLAGGNNLIGVDGGSKLIVSGVVANATSATSRLIKTGDGVLQLAGTQDNVYRSETRVLKGTLELNKTPGKNAIGGPLVIGDNIGGDNAATVKLLANNQIPQLDYFDTTLLATTMGSSGVLDLNGFSDTIGDLNLTTGSTYSSDVMTGSGVLTLGGTVTMLTFQGSSGATPAATISGNLDLGTFFSGGGAGTGAGVSRRFNINDTQIPNVAADLIISADITGASDVSITHAGGGTLRLTGNNAAWSGPYMMQGGGVLELGSDTALGSGLFSTQNNGLIVRPFGGSRTIANPISLDSNVTFLGDDSNPGVENLVFTGPVTLTGDRTLLTMDSTQTVTFAGAIGEGIFGNRVLNKSGRGTLEFTAANTYSGTTTINDDGGTLMLSGAGSLLNMSALTVGIGSTVRVDNNDGGNLTDRLSDATTITLNGGKLQFVGSATADSSEYFGTINIGGSLAATIEVENTSAGAFSTVVTGNALGLSTDRTVNFVGTGVPLSAGGANRLSFVNNPGNLDDGVLNGGRVTNAGSPAEFATLESSAEGVAVVAYPAAGYITDIAQAGATSNVKLTTPGVYALTSSKSINSLILGPGVTLAGPGATLTINSGNLMFLGAGSSAITVENLNPAGGTISVEEGHTATISSSIYSGNVQKAGLGKLVLSGDNQTAGPINVNEGVLNIQRSTALGSPAGTTAVRAGAALELEETTFGPLDIGLETVSVNGTGIASGLIGLGALRNVAGDNRLAGSVNITAPSVNLLGIYDGFGGVAIANSGVPLVDVAAGTTLTLTGDFGGGPDLGKIGGGTLELAGVQARGTDRNNRIFAGTLLLNNEAGLPASRGRFFVGTDVAGAPAATLRLGASDQIADDRRVEVLASGLFDLNGNREQIGEGNLILHIGPSNAADVSLGVGGMLTLNADIQVHTVGSGNAAGATISGGTLALQVPGIISGAIARTWQVNDGTVGSDLTVTSAIIDGTGLQSVGITKSGFGTLELGGVEANTYTGTTTLNEGTLLLNKGTGSGGVNAMSGPLTIGDANPQSGFANSDIVRLVQPDQLPDRLALVTITPTGLLDLDGNNETIGVADAQTALSMQAAATVNLGTGVLTINGNIVASAANGASLWTPVAAPRILNGTLDLGAVTRTIDVGADRNELPYELELAADLIGTGGFLLSNTGTLLLSGDNSGLSGDVVRTNGNFAIGSDTAFGSGRALLNGSITTFGGPRSISTPVIFGANIIGLGTGFNIAGVGLIGGGGNDLKFTGPVSVTPGNWFPVVSSAGQVEFAGGLGETLGTVFTRKQGFGTMVISSPATLSGNLDVGQDAGGTSAGIVRANGGLVVLRDSGTLLNSNVLIGYGSAFQLDNSGVVLADRLNDAAIIDLAGGSLALAGKAGQTVGEAMGQLRLRNNTSSSQVQAILPTGGAANWRFASYGIETIDAGSNFQFVGRGADIGPGTQNRIAFTTLPTLTDAIIPQAVLSGPAGLDFVTVTNATPSTTPFDNFVGALTSGPNFSTTLAGTTSTVNVKLAANEVVGGVITANALLLPTGGLTVSGAGSVTLDAGLLASRGVNTVSVAGLTLGSTHAIAYVDGAMSTLNVSGSLGGASTMLAKGGSGVLNLSGANTFNGVTRLTDGVVRASSDLAFGSTANGVIVQYGSTVELNGANIPAETITVAGFGESNLAAVGLRSVGGASVWQGDVNLNYNRTAIETAAGSTLTIGSAGTSGSVTNQGLNKVGTGTLQFAGTANNTFAQTSIVWQGTMELNKAPGVNALQLGDTTEFIVGNYTGADNSVVLRSLANDQIPDGTSPTPGGSFRIHMLPSGRFDLNGRTETIRGRAGAGNNHDVLVLDIGSAGSGDVQLGGGTLRIANDVAENGRVAVRVFSGGMPLPAEIAGGTLQFGGTVAQQARFIVDDSSAVEDLLVSAVIANGGVAPLNVIKNGNGRAIFSAANTYTSQTIVEQGELVVRNAGALGTSGAPTQINAGTSLLVDGVSLSEPLNPNGTGYGGVGAIRNIAGNNTLSGAMTLLGTSTIGVNAGQTLDIAAAIGGGTNGVTKLMPGTLRYSGGAAANTYTGTTNVVEGVLELNKNPNVNAIAGTLTIGNDNGMQGTDVVRLLQSNQIADAAQVQITAAGWLDLNGNSETLANASQTGLNFFLGSTTNPLVTTGAGVLTLGAGLGIQTQLAGGTILSHTGSVGARITGNLNLGGVNHNINAGDSGASVRELQIDALISNGSLSSNGSGLVYLTNGGNSYAGGTTITGGGGIVVGASNALGSGAITVTTNTTSQLFASNFVGGAPTTITLPNNVLLNTSTATAATLNLRGDDNLVLTGTITNQSNNNTIQSIMESSASLTIAGTINLSNDATNRSLTFNNTTFGGGVNLGYESGTATISGQIVNGGGSTASGFFKGGSGLVLLTNNSNSFAGSTTVGAGNLRITGNGTLGGTVAEQQTFGVNSTGGGSFTISYNGQTTTALSYAATTPPTAVDVANALNNLPSILRIGGVVSVTSSNPAGPSTVYTVSFGGLLSGVDVTQIASITPTAPVTVSSAIATTVTGTGGTFVSNGAALQVVPGLSVTEPLAINNNGFGNFGALRMIDVTPGVAEISTWAGAVNFAAGGAGTWTGVDGGGLNPDRLILSGPTVSASGSLAVKTGSGELEFGGNTDNGQVVFNGVSPMDDGLEVRAGTVYFNKPQVSGSNYQAIIGGGRVTVGDGGGGANADRLVLLGTSEDQIGGAVPVTIAASGQLTMAGAVNESLPSVVTMQRLMGIAASIDTSSTRTLAITNTLDVANAGVTTGATPAATIAGNLDLGGANRSLNVADSFVLNAADDLVVSAAINGTAGNALQKDGYGTLVLTAANAHPGGTTVNSGTLDFNAPFTNGLNVLVGGTLILRDAGTTGTGAVNVNAGGSLVIDNSASNTDRIPDTATVSIAGGGLTLRGNASGSVETIGTLTLNAGNNAGSDNLVTIDSAAGGVTELQVATALTRGGSATAHWVGVGDDLGATTNSRVQVQAGATPFVNGVAPWATVAGPTGFDLVTDADGSPAAAPFFVGRVTSYNSSVNSGGIVRLNGVTDTLTADRTVDALLLENGATVNGAFMLNVGTATAGLVVSASGSNTLAPTGSVGNPGIQFGGREPLFLVESGSTLTNSSTNNSSATLRKERAGTLVMAGDNDVAAGRQLTGAMIINAGTIVVSHDDALGAEPGGTVTVNRRAALVFDSSAGNLAINNKPINVNGFGLNDDQSGALRTIGGANTTTIGTGATAVNWSTTPTFVSTGAGTRLELNANVGTGGNQLIKRGAGELIYSGGTSNSSTGAVNVNGGTLTLNKSGAAIALNGSLTIDDLGNFDDVGGGLVQYASTGVSTNMIGDVIVTVNSPGVFDINGKTDTIAFTFNINGGSVQNSAGGGTLQVNTLTASGGDFNLGSGTFNLNGNFAFATGLGAGDPFTLAAAGLNLVGGTRTFIVNDGVSLNEVVIDAPLSNGRLVKLNPGGLRLNNSANTFLAGTNEVQRVTVAGATAGTSQFNINFNGNVTAAILVNASDAVTRGLIQSALEALTSVGVGGVNVSVAGAGLFNIEFTGHLAEQDIPNQITTTVVVGPGTFTPSTVTGGVAGINHSGGILSVGNDTALGTARVQMGNAQLLPVGGDRTLANSFALLNNVTTVWGGRRDFSGTDDLRINGGITLHSATGTGQVVNLDVIDPMAPVTFAGVISGGGNFIVPTKRGAGIMVWSGNNTFDVRDTITGVNGGTGQTDGIRIENGVLRISHSNALGGGNTANVHVRSDYLNTAGLGYASAALELDGSLGDVNLPANRNIVVFAPDNTLAAFGYLARTSSLDTATGVVNSLAGANSVAGIFDIRNIADNDNFGRAFVGVESGRLTLTGEIFGTRNNGNSDIRNNRDMIKVGAGELEITGNSVNRLTGNTGVLEGTLILNNVPGMPAVSGTLVVGDNIGPANSDRVILAGSEQIPDGVAVVVTGSGQLLTNAAQAASVTNEVQQVQVGNTTPAGQFRLQFNGATTADISFGESLASIQSKLNALATIGGSGRQRARAGLGAPTKTRPSPSHSSAVWRAPISHR